MFAKFLAIGMLAFGLIATASAQEKKEEKKKDEEARKGTVTGIVTAKGDNWIEVKADGEEKARRYTPFWKGGLPKDGGGFDKKIMTDIKDVAVKSRIRLEWTFQERPRVEKIEVLKKADEKEKP